LHVRERDNRKGITGGDRGIIEADFKKSKE
jgi:hypothetical protein